MVNIQCDLSCVIQRCCMSYPVIERLRYVAQQNSIKCVYITYQFSGIISRMSGSVMKRITPLCSCASIRSNILYDGVAVTHKVSSFRGIVKKNSIANHLGLAKEVSTTSQCAAATEAGVASGFSPSDSTAKKPVQEKRIPKKAKLIRRKPTTMQTDQKV